MPGTEEIYVPPAPDSLARIQSLAAALSETQNIIDVGRIACVAARQAVVAAGSVLMRPTERGDLTLVAWDGYDEATVDRFKLITAGPPETPAMRVLETGQPIFLEDHFALERSFAGYAHASKGHPQNNAWAVLPCRCRGATLGVLSLAFPQSRRFTPAERATLATIADLCGQALDRTQLLEEEHVRRVAAEQQMEWAKFQAQASDVMSLSLDQTRILEGVSRLAVPRLATWVTVDLVAGSDLRRLVLVHADPVTKAEAGDSFMQYPGHDADSPLAAVVRSRKPLLVPRIQTEPVQDNPGDDENARRTAAGIGACMSLPLLMRGEVLGVISFVRKAPLTYTADDLAQAIQLVQRAALAINNARLVADLSAAAQSKALAMRVVSHDVRTPLTAALLRCETALLKDRTSPEAALATIIKRNLERIERIMRQILDATQLEAGSLNFEHAPIDLAIAAREAVTTVLPMANARELTIEQSLAAAPTTGDADRMLQVAENLLSNAVKFTPAGHKVTLRTRIEGSHAILSVSDEGVGWTLEQAEQLFHAFSRPNSGESGTGLGLYLARGVVETLGGTLEGASKGSHMGATFTVTMPLRVAA